jgi:hypothetical protein
VADTSPDDSTDTGVSQEAFNRLKTDNERLQAEVDSSKSALIDVGLIDETRQQFTDKGVPFKQADWLARKALIDVKAADDNDKRTEVIDQWVGHFGSPPEGNGQDKPAETQVPTPDAATPPAFARPDPSASGDPVGPTKIRPTIQTEAGRKFLNLPRAEQDAMVKAGEVVWSFEEPK